MISKDVEITRVVRVRFSEKVRDRLTEYCGDWEDGVGDFAHLMVDFGPLSHIDGFADLDDGEARIDELDVFTDVV